MTYKTTPEFWKYYQKLPRDIQSRADKQFQLLKQNPNYPSLMFKKTRRANYWSARISDDYRALAIQGFHLGLDRKTRRIQQPDMKRERV